MLVNQQNQNDKQRATVKVPVDITGQLLGKQVTMMMLSAQHYFTSVYLRVNHHMYLTDAAADNCQLTYMSAFVILNLWFSGESAVRYFVSLAHYKVCGGTV